LALFVVLPWPVASQHTGGGNHQGQGLIIELDNQFIKDYENLATITSEFAITGISAMHPPKNDGEVHIGGWADKAGLAGVAEIMNVAGPGQKALKAVKQAQGKITVTGAWRLWGEHGGTAAQIQQLNSGPPNPGAPSSNPPHVFEIHPVTTVKVGGMSTDATKAIGKTLGFTPHDATKAFVQGYEKLPCKIIPRNGRTRIVTQALGFNFTEFMIRLGEDPVALPDGHGVICSVYDTEGELLLRGRRMVFMKGTDADNAVKTLKKNDRMMAIGIPRISLKLVQYRLDHQNGKDDEGKPFDVNPLEWNLPYEMIIVDATPLAGDGE
jgi:hypothetical protein